MQNYVKSAKKYKQDSNNDSRVISKLIILEGFNNNKEEIDKWLMESQKIGIKTVEISMEFCWGTKTKIGQKVENYNYELFDYTEEKCKQLGLNLIKNYTSLSIMKSGVY